MRLGRAPSAHWQACVAAKACEADQARRRRSPLPPLPPRSTDALTSKLGICRSTSPQAAMLRGWVNQPRTRQTAGRWEGLQAGGRGRNGARKGRNALGRRRGKGLVWHRRPRLAGAAWAGGEGYLRGGSERQRSAHPPDMLPPSSLAASSLFTWFVLHQPYGKFRQQHEEAKGEHIRATWEAVEAHMCSRIM